MDEQSQNIELMKFRIFVEENGTHILTAEVRIQMPSEDGVNASNIVVTTVRFPVDVAREPLEQILARTRTAALSTLAQASGLLDKEDAGRLVCRMSNDLSVL